MTTLDYWIVGLSIWVSGIAFGIVYVQTKAEMSGTWANYFNRSVSGLLAAAIFGGLFGSVAWFVISLLKRI